MGLVVVLPVIDSTWRIVLCFGWLLALRLSPRLAGLEAPLETVVEAVGASVFGGDGGTIKITELFVLGGEPVDEVGDHGDGRAFFLLGALPLVNERADVVLG